MDLSKLAEKFPASEVKWRIGRSGITANGTLWCTAMPYIDARTVMNRLDSVCGPGGWWETEPSPVIAGSTLVGMIRGITICVDGVPATKYDGAQVTDFEAFKGALSGALVRAGVAWGIGRYLYEMSEVQMWEKDLSRERRNEWNMGEVTAKNNKQGNKPERFWWPTPKIPAMFLPEKGEV